MIFDALSYLRNYLPCHPMFPKVLDFINSHNLSDIEIGKVDVGEGVYAMISEYQTDDIKNKFIECHRKYIDIQIVIDGAEQIGICDRDECKIIEEYDKEKDLEKLEGRTDLITLRKGYFVIFFPQDGHAPGLKVGNSENRVKKAVFKVPL